MKPEEIQKLISEALQNGVSLEIWSYIILGILVLFASYLGAYLRRKGEHLATKEDIKGITEKVESVKHHYSSQLESIKTSMGSKLYIHQVRYEKEFEILSDLTESLVELRDSAKGLRPIADYINPKETEEERKQKRLSRYHDAMQKLYLLSEIRRPFYPKEIYDVLKELDQATWSEAVQYKNRNPDNDPKYWDKADENTEAISSVADKALTAIGDRIKKWETLDFDELKNV